MGYYINKNSKGELLPTSGKAAILAKDEGAQIISEPSEFQENLVCVTDNRIFDAAGYCFSEREFREFAEPDGRKKTWLIHPQAKELSGFPVVQPQS